MIYKGQQAKDIVAEILGSYDKELERYPEHVGDQGYFKNELGSWTAWDNMTGDCWVEDFPTRRDCIDWCNGVFH